MELVKYENQFSLLENIPIDVLTRYIQQKTNEQLQMQVQELNEKFTEQSKAIELLHNATLETQNNLINYTQATGHVKKLVNSEDYVNKTNLGKNYRLKISPQRMSKLLKYAGILQKYNEEPYSQFLSGNEPLIVRNKFITDSGFEGYKTHFHQERTWKRIYNVLENNDLYYDFLNCETKQELDNFIDNLDIE